MSINYLTTQYSTTRSLSNVPPNLEFLPAHRFKPYLFLPSTTERLAEGGLRLKGYFKDPDSLLITIIIVVYNGEKTLENSILSIINQSYDNIELIIVDGGSNDNTIDIIRKYNDYIDYWISEPDFGIYDAFNKAIRVSLGKFYFVVGCDDILFDGAVEQIAKTHLSTPNIDFIVAAVWIGNNLRTGIHPDKAWLGPHAMITSHSLGLIVRTSIHQEIGLYSTRFPQCADGLFIKQLFSNKLVGIASDVIMGKFSTEGISNTHVARGLCEGFLVQLATEKNKTLQFLIFILRLIKNFNRL